MAKYRIVKEEKRERFPQGEYKDMCWYIVEKRFLGFLWWYNFFRSEYSTGQFDTYERAEHKVDPYSNPTHIKRTVIKQF